MSRYDRRDPKAAEMKLVRAGHYLWRLRANLVRTGAKGIDLQATDDAIEIIWKAKREVKAEIKARSEASFAKWRARA